MVTPSGPRMACCDRVLNNTSWTFTSRSCPMAYTGDHLSNYLAQSSLPAQSGPVVQQSLWRTVAIAE